jgi:TolA-binding protein
MANYEMARQMSTCDVKSAISDLKATALSENCADRTALNESTNNIITAMNAGFQGIKDQLFQNQMDAMRQENENLRMQNYIRSISDSNNQQTQQLFANNQAQTDRIMDFLNPPYARPYYGNNGGCCCNNNFNPCCGNS